MSVGLGKGCLAPGRPTPREGRVKAGISGRGAGGDARVWDLSKGEGSLDGFKVTGTRRPLPAAAGDAANDSLMTH